MGNYILTIENSTLHDGGYVWKPCWPGLALLSIAALLTVVLVLYGIYYGYQRIKRSRQAHSNRELAPSGGNYELFLRVENYKLLLSDGSRIMVLWNAIPIVRNTIEYDICLYHGRNILSNCVNQINILARSMMEINRSIDQIIFSNEKRKLTCFCDGSYSHREKIGYAGFRASNGFGKTRFFTPDQSRNGSTATEVLAAFLAIQYALKEHYQKLTIYTDNSKVEQLLKQRKRKDYSNYPDICRILTKYCGEKGQNSIEVIRVRGHPTIDEQRTCQIKAQFAKIDRIVRKKTRQYTKRRRIRLELDYYYWHHPVSYWGYRCTVFGYYI